MIVQDIINAVSVDTRQVINSTGNDAITVLGWVDRIHKEVLHTSNYITFNMNTTQVSTTVGTTTYTLTPPTPIRRLVSVYDTVFNRVLTPSDVISNPSPVAARAEESRGEPYQQVAMPRAHEVFRYGGIPEYYRFIAPSTFVVTPAAIGTLYTSTLGITYEQLVTTLLNTTSVLLIPDDGKDVIVAGVNWLASVYIGRQAEIQMWFQVYQQLKTGERVGVMR